MDTINAALTYLFAVPPTSFEYQTLVLAFVGILTVASIGGHFWIKTLNYKIKGKISSYPVKGLTTAAGIAAAIFFRANSVPMLSGRAVLAFMIVLGIYFIITPFRIYNQALPSILAHQTAKKEKYKYLPKKKKKKKKKR